MKSFIACKSKATALRHNPSAVKIIKVDGGYLTFDNQAEYLTWKKQK